MAATDELGDPTRVTLGVKTYTLVPQHTGRIGRKLGAIRVLAGELEADGDDALVEGLSDRLYDALQVFIPDLAPRHEVAGFRRVEDFEAVRANTTEPDPDFVDPRTDEDDELSPTPPQILDAIDAIYQIHGGSRLVRLLKTVVTQETIQRVTSAVLVSWAQARLLDPSPTAASPKVGSDPSMSSSTSVATPAPSPVETPDSPPTSDDATRMTTPVTSPPAIAD